MRALLRVGGGRRGLRREMGAFRDSAVHNWGGRRMFKEEQTRTVAGRRAPRHGAWLGAALFFSLALMAALPVATAPALAADLLPDLVADPPGNAQTPNVIQLADGQNHLVLRFNGSIHNIGNGPLEIGGSNPVNGDMTVTWQRIYSQVSPPVYHDDTSRHPKLHFENSDGHNHWHLMAAARFSLWNQAGTVQVAPAAKVGFCIEDGEKVDSFAAPTPSYDAATQIHRCNEGLPNAPSVFEGISSGWQDVYGANVYFQWIDVTDVAPGLYRLGAQMDPNNFVIESNESNNGPTLMASTVPVPGYVASSSSASFHGTTAITLSAQRYGSPGSRLFKIGSAPAHGKLNMPVGARFSSEKVVYTPDRGYVGPDKFTFSALDSASAFPLHPPVATVSVTVQPKPIRLLTALRYSRHGQFLNVQARAKLSGSLRLSLKKGKRSLGSCKKGVRSKHRFACKIKLRNGASPSGAKMSSSLRAKGKLKPGLTYKVPRHIRSV
jgi:hypothetical protein